MSEQFGVWNVLRSLGSGGQGRVYLCEHIYEADKNAAIKVLDVVDPDGPDPFALERFRQEFRLLQGMDHAHIVKVFELEYRGSTDEFWMAMEFIDGEELDPAGLSGVLLPDRVELARVLAHTIAYMHSCHVFHRDLKPANILVRRADRLPVLVDFGVALPLDAKRQRMTRQDMQPGTHDYAPPEYFDPGLSPALWDREHHDPEDARKAYSKVDIYQLGLIIHEVLGGAPVSTRERLIAAVRTTDTEPALSDLVEEMTAIEPDDRPTAERVARRLEQIANILPGAKTSWIRADLPTATKEKRTALRTASARQSPRPELAPNPTPPARHDLEYPAVEPLSGARNIVPDSTMEPAQGKRATRWWLVPLVLVMTSLGAGLLLVASAVVLIALGLLPGLRQPVEGPQLAPTDTPLVVPAPPVVLDTDPPIVVPTSPTLCLTTETPRFACGVRNNNRVSVCQASDGALIYRFGKPGAVTLTFPEVPEPTNGDFSLAGEMISFSNGDVTYSVGDVGGFVGIRVEGGARDQLRCTSDVLQDLASVGAP